MSASASLPLPAIFRFTRAVQRGLLLASLLWGLPGLSESQQLCSSPLISFTVVATSVENKMQWTTTSQPCPLVSFAVERSDNGQDFHQLAIVPTQVNTGNCSYKWHEVAPVRLAEEVAYYRLCLVYADGNKRFSSVRAVRAPKTSGQFERFPTILGDGPFRYQYTGTLAANATLEVSNSKGQQVWRQAAGTYLATGIALPHLPVGWYVVRLNNNQHSYSAFFCQQ